MQVPSPKVNIDNEGTTVVAHPSGKVKHGGAIQVLRCLLFVSFFIAGCFRYFSPTIYLSTILTSAIVSSQHKSWAHLYIGSIGTSTTPTWP
jgi:hypothetical protein